MKILVPQMNPIIGDLKGNTEKILQAIESGKQQHAKLVLFPELALCGYPPQDFLLMPHFIDEIEKYLQIIVQATKGIAAIIGLPRLSLNSVGKQLCNSAAIIEDGRLVRYADKILLPTYDVFDERRYFEPGENVTIWQYQGLKIAVTICEDIWQLDETLKIKHYTCNPITELQKHKIDLLLNLSASPFSTAKFDLRLSICKRAARDLHCPVLLCNQVGANDSLIFDGSSLFVTPQGKVKQAPTFQTDLWLVDLAQLPVEEVVKPNPVESLYQALVMGVRDYFTKLHFKQACLGLSGGIDSAVVACIAADALGSNNVFCVGMPSRYSSGESLRDAALLAKNLGAHFQEIGIEQPFETYLSLLSPVFKDTKPDLTEENLQARIRGMLLMALSNKFGYLVLSTGNKSEWAMGYSTLYGDMCGSLSVLGDVTKQQVYALARWINRESEVIPLYTIEREPTAELRPDQKDCDSLPPYAVIDQVLQAYIENHQSPEQIAQALNVSVSFIEGLILRIHQNEFKRRQAPPALRVSEKAFSIGRHFPIVQRFVESKNGAD